MGVSSSVVDESHPAYLRFLDCFAAGASLQDIYSDSSHGFGVRERQPLTDPEDERRLLAACRLQFERVFSHSVNLADPIDRTLGLTGKLVLDFGCGTGALAVAVALKGAVVTAADPTAISLEACRWRALYFGLDEVRVKTVQLDIRPTLPFADASFDLVTCNSVFEFIPSERQAYLRELVRVTRPGGHVVLSTENGLYPRDYYTRLWFPLLRREKMRRLNVPYGLTYFELRRWLRATGRRVVDRSVRNEFNSLDNFVARRRLTGSRLLASASAVANAGVKGAFRLIGLPSQLLFPYTTFVFEVH